MAENTGIRVESRALPTSKRLQRHGFAVMRAIQMKSQQEGSLPGNFELSGQPQARMLGAKRNREAVNEVYLDFENTEQAVRVNLVLDYLEEHNAEEVADEIVGALGGVVENGEVA